MNAHRSDAQVEQLVQEHRRLVEHIVDRYTRRYQVGSMEREDLVSWGLIGLYHAARAWDESRSLQFSTLAWMAIERSIFRGVRREWHPDEARVTVSLDEMLTPAAMEGDETSLSQMLPDPRAEETTRTLDVAVAIRDALNRLPAGERDLILERYYEGRSCAEIGTRTGRSRQTIHLREKATLRRLRQVLGSEFAAALAA